MGSQTARFAIPYPVGTDRVMDGDNAMQAIAERVDLLMSNGFASTWQTLTPLAGSSLAGYRPLGYRRIGNMVYTRGIISGLGGGLSAGAVVFVFPVGYRPVSGTVWLGINGDAGGARTNLRVSVDVNGNLLITEAVIANGNVGLDGLFFTID